MASLFRSTSPVRNSERIEGIEIRGGDDFRLRTREAVMLLQKLAAFELIRTHLAVIRQGRCSGVRAWAQRPVFTVGTPTWNHSAVWYAGAIAHDALHAKLYRDAKKRNPTGEPSAETWSGKAAEKACLAFQSQVLAGLDADEAMIAYVEKHADNPNYQGRNQGWGSWLDYRKRWW
jgi:hypothetical protein